MIQPILKTCLFFCCVSLTLNVLAGKPVVQDAKDIRGGVFTTGQIYIGGQPLTEQALTDLKASGVTTIVNLRTADEMENRHSTPIDEEEIARKLAMQYIHLPSGGPDHPYTPETVAQFANALDAADGKVFLHCNSGTRATHLWVAWLVDHRQMDINEAVALGRAARFGSLPVEGYLQGSLGFELKSD